jgi:hypothetical protein
VKVTDSHFHPSLIFAGKAWSLPKSEVASEIVTDNLYRSSLIFGETTFNLPSEKNL